MPSWGAIAALIERCPTSLQCFGDDSLFCPTYHTIFNHYDPSGPIFVDNTWHVFPDGGPHGWAHFTSTDLLNWTEHESTVADRDTGSVSLTNESDAIVLFPTTSGPVSGLLRQVPTDGRGGLAPDVSWTSPMLVAKNPGLGVGFRDPSRALQMADGAWYVGVGTGFGGENNSTGLPGGRLLQDPPSGTHPPQGCSYCTHSSSSAGNGTGCLAWMRATNASLKEFQFAGCLLNNTHTDGHIDPSTVSWSPQDRIAAFVECPDVFPLGDGDKYVVIASLYNWKVDAPPSPRHMSHTPTCHPNLPP